MLQWIWDNKEWLFSGVGLAIIAMLSKLATRLVTADSPTDSHTKAPTVSTARPVKRRSLASWFLWLGGIVWLMTAVAVFSPTTVSDLRRVFLLPQLQEAPPPSRMQQEVLAAPQQERQLKARSYIGMRARWKLELIGALDTRGTTSLVLREPSSRLEVYCSVPSRRYPYLKVAQRGTAVQVDGQIDFANVGLVRLRDVRLMLYD